MKYESERERERVIENENGEENCFCFPICKQFSNGRKNTKPKESFDQNNFFSQASFRPQLRCHNNSSSSQVNYYPSNDLLVQFKIIVGSVCLLAYAIRFSIDDKQCKLKQSPNECTSEYENAELISIKISANSRQHIDFISRKIRFPCKCQVRVCKIRTQPKPLQHGAMNVALPALREQLEALFSKPVYECAPNHLFHFCAALFLSNVPFVFSFSVFRTMGSIEMHDIVQICKICAGYR